MDRSPYSPAITGEAFPDVTSVLADDGEELIIGEEKIESFMQELYKEMTTKKDAAADTSAVGTSWTAEEGYGCASATGKCLKWNEWESESCGAAVSDTASTVMAGVEYDGKMVPAPESGRRCGCQCGSNGGLVVVAAEGGEINGCGECGAEEDRKMDGVDEEEWFARVMSWGPADLVPGVLNDVQCGGSSYEAERLDQMW